MRQGVRPRQREDDLRDPADDGPGRDDKEQDQRGDTRPDEADDPGRHAGDAGDGQPAPTQMRLARAHRGDDLHEAGKQSERAEDVDQCQECLAGEDQGDDAKEDGQDST